MMPDTDAGSRPLDLAGYRSVPAALVATGRVDAVEMIVHEPFNHREYYRYLNSGDRLPLVGGTDGGPLLEFSVDGAEIGTRPSSRPGLGKACTGLDARVARLHT